MEVVQLDDPLEAGLQVAILFEHPVILLADGLLDSDDLAASRTVVVPEFGGAGMLAPSWRARGSSGPGCQLPHGVRTMATTSIPQPRSQSAFQRPRCAAPQERSAVAGLVAGIDVDEHGAPGVQRDRQLEREAGISLPKYLWDNDLATPCERRVSLGVSERRKSRYPLGLREKHAETERSGGSAGARSCAEDVA